MLCQGNYAALVDSLSEPAASHVHRINAGLVATDHHIVMPNATIPG
jgi:hypothetical protein